MKPRRQLSAVTCFEDDLAACSTDLQLPVAHCRATRTTHLLKRLFLEQRRCAQTFRHALGEQMTADLAILALKLLS